MAENITTFNPAMANKVKSASAGYLQKLTSITPFSSLDESLGNYMACHDRFHNCSLLPNMMERTGNVFITRPKLNLSSPNLKKENIFAPLNTYNPMSSAFMVRCLLDTHFIRDPDVMPLVTRSPLIHQHSPFLLPMCNGLIGLSGAPDFVVETETTEGGYYSENQTYAIGSDRLYKTYNLNLTFKDVPSSPIFFLTFYWLWYMASVTLGTMASYPFHIDGRILDYTVSIYQFIMDPTRRFINKWVKYTGCFPISLPIGDIFSFSEQSMLSEASGKLTIPFIVNHVSYLDPLRIADFNILVKRYAPNVESKRIIKADSVYNHVRGSVPYIVGTPMGYVLTYRDMLGIVPDEYLETEGSFASAVIAGGDDQDVPFHEVGNKNKSIDALVDKYGLPFIDDHIKY